MAGDDTKVADLHWIQEGMCAACSVLALHHCPLCYAGDAQNHLINLMWGWVAAACEGNDTTLNEGQFDFVVTSLTGQQQVSVPQFATAVDALGDAANKLKTALEQGTSALEPRERLRT